MRGNLPTRRLLTGLAAGFLLAGCAAGTTPSPSATAAATTSVTVATSTPTPSATAAAATSVTVAMSAPTRTQSPASTSSPEPSIPVGPPAAPTGATYHDDQTLAQVPVIVGWHEASPEGVTILVYGVTECLAPVGSTGVGCVTEKSKIPDSVLFRISAVAATRGTTGWTWTGTNIGGALGVYNSAAYSAIVLRAVNGGGQSPFVVAGTTKSCFGCVY
jgi:hypothetical protein